MIFFFFDKKFWKRKKYICSKKLFFTFFVNLSVSLGDTLDLILLLDGVGVGGALGGVDELVGEALGHGLEVAEGRLAGTLAHQVDGLIDAAEGRDVDGLAADDTTSADTSGVLAGSALGDGVDDDLDRVGGVLGGEVGDLERVADDADGEELLAVGAHFEHEAVDEALNDGALDLSELLLLEAARGVGDVDGVDGDVVGERRVVDLDVVERPFSEELGNLGGHL